MEADLRHLKQAPGRDVLRGETVPGAVKERLPLAAVCKLVRRVMRGASRRQEVAPARISFVGALRWLRQARAGDDPPRLRVNRERPGRVGPRVRKRRPMQYTLMQKPCEELRQALLGKQCAANLMAFYDVPFSPRPALLAVPLAGLVRRPRGGLEAGQAAGQEHAAMVAELDDAVGDILAKLRDLKLDGDTLVFFISDNGGAGAQSDKGGLSGGKWNLLEGGVRVPFLVQWKGRVPAGKVQSVPVVQLDVLPTALAAAGVPPQPGWKLDGVNLLTLLEGKADALDREALYWRFGVQFAVRRGDWKLVKPSLKEEPKLFNLKDDRAEKTDLAAKYPDRAKELKALWDKWNAGNVPPRWEDRRWNGDEERKKNEAD